MPTLDKKGRHESMERFKKDGKPTAEALADEKELQKKYPPYRGVDADYVHAGTEALERWWDWKFGIRIHWSIYAMTGAGPESWSMHSGHNGGGDTRAWNTDAIKIYREQYEELYKIFNPRFFSGEEWADLFVRAGLKFFTFTTKHHDGFSMYDTKTRIKKRFVHAGPNAGKMVDCDLRYSIMESPFKRDITGELVKACRARDLGIGLYFSHIDWFDSDFRIDQWDYYQDPGYTRQSDPQGYKRMIARHREQIREILSNYGKIDLLSLDMSFPDNGRKHGIRDDLVETIKMARRLQPQLLIRNRGVDPYGDYKSPEREVPLTMDSIQMPWKVIYPGSSHFSHVWLDEYKSPQWVITNLIDICSKGGMFQVGYGPGPDGRFAAEIVRVLEDVGRWLKVNGEGIYATRPFKVFKEGPNVRFTRSKDGRYVYAFILNWPESPVVPGTIDLQSVKAKRGSKISMLGIDHAFEYAQDGGTLSIRLPSWMGEAKKRPYSAAQVFKIEVDKK
jgi:alpha-L-fucosidase